MHFLEGDYYYTKIFCPTTFVITLVTYKNIIYDIGPKILNLQCLNLLCLDLQVQYILHWDQNSCKCQKFNIFQI